MKKYSDERSSIAYTTFFYLKADKMSKPVKCNNKESRKDIPIFRTE